MVRVAAALVFEMLLLWLGVLNARAFAFTTKTLSFHPISGNPFEAWIRPLKGGFVNAVGLANPGLRHWIDEDLASLVRRRIKPIVSIAPNTVDETRVMVGLLAKCRADIRAIELNPGCPNTSDGKRMFIDPHAVVEIVCAARNELVELGWECPVILKLSAAHDWSTIIRETETSVDAFELVNSVPWKMHFGEAPSPLAHFGGGGVSGPMIFLRVSIILRDARRLTKKSIIAGGGIHNAASVGEAFNLEADAVAIGTGFLLHPLELAKLVKS